jgi:hypothetical protein
LWIKHDLVEVGAFDEGTFFVSALLSSGKDGFKWEMVVVYETTQHGKSKEFLEELAGKCSRTKVTMVIGGDFNLIRGRGDKNNNNIDWKCVDMFNEFIANQQLHELKRGEGTHTWSNR